MESMNLKFADLHIRLIVEKLEKARYAKRHKVKSQKLRGDHP
jgi:hypothetical protein